MPLPSRRTGRHRPWAVLLALGLAAAGTAAADSASVLVQTDTLAKRTLSETVAAYGRIQTSPDQLTSITLPRAGIVNRLWIRLGQRVKAGQPLLELITAPNALMQFQQAKAAVDNARTKLQHLRIMFKQKLATQNQVADAERNLRDAEASLHAQEMLGTSQRTETIRAPFAGIVTQLPVDQGQRVQANTMAMLLASGENLVVLLGLETEDALRVHPGQAVVLSPVFSQSPVITTQVYEIHAMVDPKTRLVDALVHIPNQYARHLMLNEAMRGIITLRQIDTLSVPRSALLRDDRGAYLFKVSDGRAHRVNVTTGLEQGRYVAVSGGLKAGDEVVVLGNYELQDGMAVREARQ